MSSRRSTPVDPGLLTGCVADVSTLARRDVHMSDACTSGKCGRARHTPKGVWGETKTLVGDKSAIVVEACSGWIEIGGRALLRAWTRALYRITVEYKYRWRHALAGRYGLQKCFGKAIAPSDAGLAVNEVSLPRPTSGTITRMGRFGRLLSFRNEDVELHTHKEAGSDEHHGRELYVHDRQVHDGAARAD